MTGDLCSSRTSRILSAKECFEIQRPTVAGIQGLGALIYFSAKRVKFFHVRKQLATNLLLVGVRQPRNLRNGLFERFDHF